MSALEELIKRRGERDAVRAEFNARLETVRSDVDARSVPGRVADSALEKVQDMLDEAVVIAGENPAVVGGTIAALAIWLFRTPIMALVQHLMNQSRAD